MQREACGPRVRVKIAASAPVHFQVLNSSSMGPSYMAGCTVPSLDTPEIYPSLRYPLSFHSWLSPFTWTSQSRQLFLRAAPSRTFVSNDIDSLSGGSNYYALLYHLS